MGKDELIYTNEDGSFFTVKYANEKDRDRDTFRLAIAISESDIDTIKYLEPGIIYVCPN